MSAVRLGPRDLLEYDARFCVLICRECQYAVQKSALQSHLLKHKIYREDRQRLLSSISRLNLLEPDHVPHPPPNSPPINGLPIIPGFRCTVPGCNSLCASSKRMRRHQTEVHGPSGPDQREVFGFVRPATLQTFFRGTKLRYFEVAVPTAEEPYGGKSFDEQRHDADRAEESVIAIEEDEKDGDDDCEMYNCEEVSERVRDADKILPERSPVDFSLETLKYFHHFITTTSLTLPSFEAAHSPLDYWQSNVVLQALRRRWLMCGLLALSACHLTTLVEETVSAHIHRERAVQFSQEFSAGLERSKQNELNAENQEVEEAIKAGRRIQCALSCALGEPTAPSQMLSTIASIRNLVSSFTQCPAGIGQDWGTGKEEMFAQASRILKTGPYNTTPSQLLDRLGTLPFQMTKAFGRPDSAQNVLALMAAVAALVECCDRSFASNDAEAAWQGMATWLAKVPDQFNQMIASHDLAALVVIAHWTPLIKRAEQCGCWFLGGSAERVQLEIAERLPPDSLMVRQLVADLIS